MRSITMISYHMILEVQLHVCKSSPKRIFTRLSPQERKIFCLTSERGPIQLHVNLEYYETSLHNGLKLVDNPDSSMPSDTL